MKEKNRCPLGCCKNEIEAVVSDTVALFLSGKKIMNSI